jgi:hypothetical protein
MPHLILCSDLRVIYHEGESCETSSSSLCFEQDNDTKDQRGYEDSMAVVGQLKFKPYI